MLGRLRHPAEPSRPVCGLLHHDIRLKKLIDERECLLEQIKKLKGQLEGKPKNSKLDHSRAAEDVLENGTGVHVLDLQSRSSWAGRRSSLGAVLELPCRGALHSPVAPETQDVKAQKCSFVGGQERAGGDANRQISDLKFKLAKSEQEITALEQNLRSALDKTEELEVSNGHLVKRLEKMKANRSALLTQQFIHRVNLALQMHREGVTQFCTSAPGILSRTLLGSLGWRPECRPEYRAEEQEYISNHLSFVQAKTSSISNLEVELRNSGHEVQSASNLEDNPIKLESSSVISSDSLNVVAQEYTPCVSKFQNCDLLKEYYEPKYEKCKEQETSLMYPIVFVQRGNSLGNEESQAKNDFLNPQTALKTKTCTETMKSQISENKDFCGNAVVKNRISQHLENPSTISQDRALETLQESSKVCQTSWSSIFDDSVISAYGCSHYESLQSTPDPALGFAVPPRIAIRDDQTIKEDSSLKAINGNNMNKACSEEDGKGTYPKSVIDAAGCTVTVHQTVDVSTDFRACFTTSRATNARPSVVSTSSNTEVTMMSKKRPSKWQSGKQKSVACNTDWSYGQDGVDTPVAITKGSGKSLSVDSSQPNGNFQNKKIANSFNEMSVFSFSGADSELNDQTASASEVSPSLKETHSQVRFFF
ncbi:RNA-binding protein 44 [Heterocephalus glaber]|uniref:RNA-binding protein 44 n=1 Tax=Heterocephalus glaber TaxID=10181 RepID=G5AY52_HETGA|nr:RNA-binding protein 44 [Heterocephalus glaber]